MRLRFFIAAAIGLLAPDPIAAGLCPPWECPPPPWDEEVVGGDLGVVVATIVSVDDSAATLGNPPRVLLKVERVLRGAVPAATFEMRWRPYPLYSIPSANPCSPG